MLKQENGLNSELLTRKQVAELLKIDLSTLWIWTKKGKLKSYGLSSKVYYLRSEVLDSLIPLNHSSKAIDKLKGAA